VIEDFTGKGLSDLEAKVIRTPQDPLKMMLEDPLRVLRIVRFANRFNFKMSEDFELAA